jgi:peptidoglycan hydrolase-like protein with peptidoglycan-binding domain
MTQTAALQTVLKLAGYWPGPIDGQWTDELTAALKSFQTALGVPPSGTVDTATIAAFQAALAEAKAEPTTTTAPPTTSPPTTRPPRPTVTIAPPPTPTITAPTTTAA